LLKPGATIGILGGGQLARMLALAAAPLGLRCHVYSPEKESCAFDVVHAGTCAPYDDEAALGRFAGTVDVITYEFENVPARTAAFLARRKPVLPDPQVLETTQDRLVEKNFISALKIATAPYAPVHSATQLEDGVKSVGLPAVLKTRQLGYDGKGQAKITKGADAVAAWRSVRNAPCILEGFINFEREVSVVAARTRDGKVECFEVTENEHRDHILKISRVPAKVTAALAREAQQIATRIAKAFDYVGVLAVEMFVVRKGRLASAQLHGGISGGSHPQPGGPGPGSGPDTRPTVGTEIGARGELGPPNDLFRVYLQREGQLGAKVWERSSDGGLDAPAVPLVEQLKEAVEHAYPQTPMPPKKP